jgi:hypothetical protein
VSVSPTIVKIQFTLVTPQISTLSGNATHTLSIFKNKDKTIKLSIVSFVYGDNHDNIINMNLQYHTYTLLPSSARQS